MVIYVLHLFEWLQRPVTRLLERIGEPPQETAGSSLIGCIECEKPCQGFVGIGGMPGREAPTLPKLNPKLDIITNTLLSRNTAIETYTTRHLGVQLNQISQFLSFYVNLMVYCGFIHLIFETIMRLVNLMKPNSEPKIDLALEVKAKTNNLKFQLNPMLYNNLRELFGNQRDNDNIVANSILEILLFRNCYHAIYSHILLSEKHIYADPIRRCQVAILAKILFKVSSAQISSSKEITNDIIKITNFDNDMQVRWLEEDEFLEDDQVVQKIEFIRKPTCSIDTLKPSSSSSSCSCSCSCSCSSSAEKIIGGVTKNLVKQDHSDLKQFIENAAILGLEEMQGNVANISVTMYYPDGSPCILDCQVISDI